MISDNINKIKDPQSTLIFGFDWGDWLTGDDVIEAHTIIVDGGADIEGGLVITGDYHTDTQVRFLASGGVLGTIHNVVCRIESGSQIEERTMKIHIKNR